MESSGDIDILCTHPDFTNEKKAKKQTGGILDKMLKKMKKQGKFGSFVDANHVRLCH